MAFSRRRPQQKTPPGGPWLARVLTNAIRLILRLGLSAVVIAVVIAGILYLRLSQGPIRLPYLAQIAAQAFNSDSDRFEVTLGDLVVSLGDAGAPSGVQFVGLQVISANGDPLFAIPRMSADFDIGDLLQGHLRPTRIVLIRPEAQLYRSAEGKFRFGLGDPANSGFNPDIPPESPPDDDLVPETPQLEAISRILDGLTGDGELTPELTRLTEIIISDADLIYENAAIDRRWRTRRADLRITRAETGLLAEMTVDLAGGFEAGAGVSVTAERRRGGGRATRVDLRFERLRPEYLAEQIAQLKWLDLFDAPLDGALGATIHADGRFEGLSGNISAGAGRILAFEEQGQPFDSIGLSFAYEAGLERMQVSNLSLISPALVTQLSGFVDLRLSPGGGATGLASQFEVAELHLTLPKVFADPLNFDGGQIVARLQFDPVRIEVAEARLQSDDLVIGVSGEADLADAGWQIDVRATGKNLSIAQLVGHWPLAAAKNARTWVSDSIISGGVSEFVGHMRFGHGEPLINLDFAFADLVSRYLKDMSPIREARGMGTLTLDEFHLLMESGQVVPVEGSPVRLDGSVIRMSDLQGRPSPADITLRASGATSSILALINEQPLGFMDKLGLDPATVQGDARVVAEIGFPLIQALELDEVEVQADAKLSALRLPFRLPGGQVLDVAGDAAYLGANKREMRLTGPIRIDGSPMSLDWGEYYGRGNNNREIDLKGAATPALLKRFNLDNEYFVGGEAPMTLHLSQAGSPDFTFDVKADMGPASLAVTDFNWTKPPGRPGQLEAAGTFGTGISVPNFRLTTDELKAAGAIDFSNDGEMQSAQIDRLRFRGLADIAIGAQRAGARKFDLKVSGNRLDLAMFEDPPDSASSSSSAGGSGGAGGVTALNVNFNVSELVITPRVTAKPASGAYQRDPAGHATATLDGHLDGKVRFTAEYEKAAAEPGGVVVLSDDAGALLKAAGLFRGADGGQLKLRARIEPEPGVDLVGVARIKDVRISGASTFKSILDEGGVKEAASAAEGGGLYFDKVQVPFEYRDGLMVLGDSTAKGSLLAVTMEGTVDENTNQVDLIGVISPAYALTGIVDEIPLIGDILTGGKGEGILAMTFKVKGPLDGPDFSVNPLSLLAPGILRNIFSGRSDGPNEDFIESLKRQPD